MNIKQLISTLNPLISSLSNEPLPIFLYGMGNGAEKIYAYLRENNINIKGVVASDGFVRGQEFLGYKVISISEAERQYGKLCLVLCFGLEGEKTRFLPKLAERHKLYSPNLPVFKEGVCDFDFISENIEKFQRLYDILADEESKEIFLSLIKYNITGDFSYLSYGNDLPAPKEFYSHKGIHIDIGAYDGDTATEYAQKSDGYSQIIAFEPDKNTYKKLLKNTKDIRSCFSENAAVSDRNGEIEFASGGGRASHCGEGGDKIKTVSIDNYCGFNHIGASGMNIGSIKIDAEGMDRQVIYGAVNTIYCCKPHLSIALYHCLDDIIELPLLIRKHNHKYQLYLRKKEYVPAWDVFIYAIQPQN